MRLQVSTTLYIVLAIVWGHAQAGIGMFFSIIFVSYGQSLSVNISTAAECVPVLPQSKARMVAVISIMIVLLTTIASYVMTMVLDVWPWYLYIYVPFAYTSAAHQLMMYNGGGQFVSALLKLWFGGTLLIGFACAPRIVARLQIKRVLQQSNSHFVSK